MIHFKEISKFWSYDGGIMWDFMVYLCSLDTSSIVKFGFDPHPPYPKFHHYTNLSNHVSK